MKAACTILFGFLFTAATFAQGQLVEPAEILQSIQAWGQTNVDAGELEKLGVDPNRFQKLLEMEPTEILRAFRGWVQTNVDSGELEKLGIGTNAFQQFFDEVQRLLGGTSVYDLGSLRKTAAKLLPLLERSEGTQPVLTPWLKARLDDFEVAENLRNRATPTRGSTTLAPPTPQLERSVWVKQLEKRPPPADAEKYLPALKQAFVAENVPEELVWLAEVESAFNPLARSPVGAAGIFQLMPPTARSLGLSTWLPDERLNPEKNARAAAQYLRHLYDRFGDWRLALAAYNAGETRVAALLRRHDARTFDAIAQHLPAETQMYVPKVEATVRQRAGVALTTLKAPKG